MESHVLVICIAIAATFIVLWPIVFVVRLLIDFLVGVYWGMTLSDDELAMRLFVSGTEPTEVTSSSIAGLLTALIWGAIYYFTH